jgi:uncharacterized damage-inducible protein DinB
MSVERVRTTYAYNRWANRRLLDAVGQLQPQDFVRSLGGSFDSVQATLVHIMWAEWLWLRRWRGESPKRLFDPKDFPCVADIESRWDGVERDQADFIARLTDERLTARISYQNFEDRRWEYTLADMMQHIANHSSYHRGQVVASLRQLGQRPPATDFLVYLDEIGTVPTVGT